MTAYITEHYGIANRGQVLVIPSALTSYSLSSASTSPFPAAGAQFIRVTSDAGMFLGFNASTATTLTSTNAFRIPPNAPAELFAVSTSMRVIAQST